MKTASPLRIRSGLAGLALLLTAARAMAAGATALGLAVRVAVAAAGFWVVGGFVERLFANPPAHRPAPAAAGQSAVGRALNVTLPAVGPEPAEPPATGAVARREP